MINEIAIGLVIGTISSLIGLFLITSFKYYKEYNLLSYYKICFYLFVIFITLDVIYDKTYLTIIGGVCLWFVQNRISDFIKSIGIINSIMYKYISYNKDSSEIQIRDNCTPEEIIKSDIVNSTGEVLKLTLNHNYLIDFLHECRCLYDDHFRRQDRLVSNFFYKNIEDKISRMASNKLRTSIEFKKIGITDELIVDKKMIIHFFKLF